VQDLYRRIIVGVGFKAKQRIAHPLPTRRRQAQNKVAKGRPRRDVSAC